jgi:phosphatidylglycerophosphate synthase
MVPAPHQLVIDARPRGPRGPLAVEPVQGRTVLEHLLDVAASVAPAGRAVAIHARVGEHELYAGTISTRPSGRFVLTFGPPPENAVVLRTDRLYDAGRLRRALRRGAGPESSVIWRLDGPEMLAAAGDELVRRQTYQPLGRYWALDPARRLARALAPTRVRPNAVTLASALLVFGASALVAFEQTGWLVNLLSAFALALALVLDTADGHLARLQGTASEFGRWLDAWLDEAGDMALHAAIAWSVFSRTGDVRWLLLGILYSMGKYVYVVGATGPTSGGAEVSGEASLVVEGLPTKLVRLAGHADVRWHLWIVLAAVGRLDLALATYSVYFPARALAALARKAVRRG